MAGRGSAAGVEWRLQTPFRQQVTTGSQRLNVAGDTTSYSLSLPAKLSGGIFILHYAFSDSQKRSVSRGKLRFSIGRRLGYGSIVRQLEWGEGEILQVQYGARMYLTALGEGCTGYSYHTLEGLTHDSLMNPLLALKALHTMDSVLGDAVPAGKVDVGHDFVCYLFQTATKHLSGANGHSVVAGLWPKDAEYAQPIPITFRGRITVSAVALASLGLLTLAACGWGHGFRRRRMGIAGGKTPGSVQNRLGLRSAVSNDAEG